MHGQGRIEAFLADYPETVRETVRAARAYLARLLPDAQESLDRSAKLIGYSYGPGYKGVVCTLILSQSGVKLGIARGVELPDPKRLMAGSGKIHRHVQLRSAADLARPGLEQLMNAALSAWRKRNAADD
jgi:hypothetical protein